MTVVSVRGKNAHVIQKRLNAANSANAAFQRDARILTNSRSIDMILIVIHAHKVACTIEQIRVDRGSL